MKKLALVVLFALAPAAVALSQLSCTGGCDPNINPDCNGGVGGGSGGGSGGGAGGALDRYTKVTLDAKRSDRMYMDMAVDKTKNRVGIAYISGVGEYPILFNADGGLSQDAGMTPFYEIRYVEWEDGVAKPPEIVDMVQRFIGISVSFHPTTGQPAVAYLGGGADMSTFWLNSDAVVSFRQPNGTWMKDVVATNGSMYLAPDQPNSVSDNMTSFVVGIWPAIKYDSKGVAWFCYRDVHTGQYPQQDWAGSDVECVHGGPGSWTGECVEPGGNHKHAPGGHIAMAMMGAPPNDAPVIVWDQEFGGAETSGQNVFTQNRASGAWNWFAGSVMTIGSTQAGATLAWDPTEGLGVAAVDGLTSQLFYVHKAPSSNVFTTADPVYGMGTGGWYPSLAMDPMFHEPAIAFYICSGSAGVNPGSCKPDYDELRVVQRISGNWQTQTVDTDAVGYIRLGFLPLPSGKKVIGYRDYANGAIKLAVER